MNTPARHSLSEIVGDDPLFSPREVSTRYMASCQTLARWRFEHRGPRYVKLPNGRVRYRRSDLIEWENLAFKRCGGEAMAEAA